MSRRTLHRAKRNSVWVEGRDSKGREWKIRARGLPHNDNLPKQDVRSPFKKSMYMRDHRTGNLIRITGAQALAMHRAIDPNYKPAICTRASKRD